jgi:hypothetical protein
LEQAKLDPDRFSGYSRHELLGVDDVELGKALIAKRMQLHDLSIRECQNEVDSNSIRLLQARRLADNWSIGPALAGTAWCFGALLLERIGVSPIVGAIAFGVMAILSGLNARDAAIWGRDEAVKEAQRELEMAERALVEQRDWLLAWERTGSP